MSDMSISVEPVPAQEADPGRLRPPWSPGLWASAATGIVAVGLAIGLAELLSALGVWLTALSTSSSPISALGATFISFTPEPLKEFAIRTFGQHDKDALRAGMGLTLIVVAAVVGLIARRSPRVAVVLTALLVGVTLAAVYTRTGSGVLDGLPMLAGGVVGAIFLVLVFRRTLVAAAPLRPDSPSGPESPSHPESPSQAVPVAGGPDDGGTADGSTEGSGKSGTSGPGHPMAAASSRAVGRRAFFRLAGLGVLVAAAAGAVARFIPTGAQVADSRARVKVPVPSDVQKIPAAVSAQVPGQQPWITPNASFYRVDTAFTLPNVTTEQWSLNLHGMVDRPLAVSFAELLDRPQIERTITLTCVSNEVGGDLLGNATWIGTRIDALLKEAGVQSGADCVLCTSADGFTLTTPLAALTDGRDALLAVAMNGEPLPVEHGFPVRMVVPGLYGYVSATKWIVDMKVSTFAAESAYWTDRGWKEQAPIKTSSRFDVPKGFAQYSPGQQVVFAGVAWAQHTGIKAVEVQVDDGPWQSAKLAGALSKDTWVQWTYPWKALSGLHNVRVRAIDSSGLTQVSDIAPPFPSGSTGYDTRSVTVS